MTALEFYKNHTVIKNKDGSVSKPDIRDIDIDFFKMIDEAHSKGCHLKRMWVRTHYRWVIVKD